MNLSDEIVRGLSDSVEPRSARHDRIHELQEQIVELKRRWPAHSIPPAMLQRLDELEEELENELVNRKAG